MRRKSVPVVISSPALYAVVDVKRAGQVGSFLPGRALERYGFDDVRAHDVFQRVDGAQASLDKNIVRASPHDGALSTGFPEDDIDLAVEREPSKNHCAVRGRANNGRRHGLAETLEGVHKADSPEQGRLVDRLGAVGIPALGQFLESQDLPNYSLIRVSIPENLSHDHRPPEGRDITTGRWAAARENPAHARKEVQGGCQGARSSALAPGVKR